MGSHELQGSPGSKALATHERSSFSIDISGGIEYPIRDFVAGSTTPAVRMSPDQSKAYYPLPSSVQDLVAALMRTIKAGKLYASGHELFKQNVGTLHGQVLEAMEEREFLFLGVAKDALFMEGSFYQAKDVHFRSFLEFFHSLGISHILFEKNLSIRELESFIECLAGAKQGQGDEVVAALPRENIKHLNLGIINYSVFSTVHTVAARLSPTGEDPSVWRQLILQPAGVGSFNLDLERVKTIARLSEDPEALKKMLDQIDHEMKTQVQDISLSQRGALLGNFLENLSHVLAAMGTEKVQQFTPRVQAALDSLEPGLRTEILGSVAPSPVNGEEASFIQDMIIDMPDQRLVYVLLDALEHSGPTSACFTHLFKRAIARYKASNVFLDLIRTEMNRATQERRPDSLNQWQHLEQLVVRHQETQEFNAQYQEAIDNLATSLKIQQPMIEQEEMARLGRTLDSEFLNLSKARLILDLLIHAHSSKEVDLFLLPLLGSMGDTVQGLLSQQRPRLVGNLLRQVFLYMSRFPKEKVAREVIYSWLRAEEVRGVLKSLMEKCRTYSPQETAALTAVCQLYPEKAGAYLVELFLTSHDRDSAQYQWTLTTLASIAPRLTKLLDQQFQKTSEASLPNLIELVDLIMDDQMAPAVEELLAHKDYAIRAMAVRTLGRLKSKNSAVPLGAILLDRSWIMGKKTKSLQMDAARALAEIGTVEAKGILHQVASEGSGDLQALCRELLQARGGGE
jgi:hypothetical protein